jgi:hypothetical protein
MSGREPRGAKMMRDGQVAAECALIRDPEPGPGGIDRWLAVPPAGYEFRSGDTLRLDLLPGRCSVAFSLPVEGS